MQQTECLVSKLGQLGNHGTYLPPNFGSGNCDWLTLPNLSMLQSTAGVLGGMYDGNLSFSGGVPLIGLGFVAPNVRNGKPNQKHYYRLLQTLGAPSRPTSTTGNHFEVGWG